MEETGEQILKTAQISAEINNVPTDVFCCNYDNMILVVITQYGKFGTMIQVKKETALESPEALPVYSINVLIGEDDDLSHVVARNLASHIDANKPILFSLALKERSPNVVKKLTELLNDCKCW